MTSNAAAQRRWAGKNPGCLPAWKAAHPEKVQAATDRATAKRRETRRARRLAALEMYGGRCACCGFDDPRALCIDHVNGDGAARRQPTAEWYRTLLARPRDPSLQVLCANCNMAKGTGPACPLEHDKDR